MPEELVKELENIPNKSQFISQALREKLKRDTKTKLESLLIEGYKKTRAEDKDLAKDWDKPTVKGWE